MTVDAAGFVSTDELVRAIRQHLRISGHDAILEIDAELLHDWLEKHRIWAAMMRLWDEGRMALAVKNGEVVLYSVPIPEGTQATFPPLEM